MISSLNQVPSETQIKKHLRKIIFGKNVFCPFCRSRKIYSLKNRYHCTKCRKHFSLISATWLKGMKLSLRTFWLVLWCWTQKVPVLQTMKLSGLSEEAIRRWFRQFRLHLPYFEPILAGKVQMDEAYFKNLSLILAKQEKSKKLAHQIIFKNSVNRTEAANFLFQYVKPRSRLRTDGSSIYQGINRWWPVRHKRDIHRRFELAYSL